jgi:hypothetical protein
VITTFFQYLTSDEKLSELLNHYPYENKLKIFFMRPQVFNKDQENEKGSFVDYPYVVYNLVPFSHNIVTNEYRVQLTIVTDKEEELSNISNRLVELMDFSKANVERPSTTVNNTVILNSQLMTGGSLFFHESENVFEQINYFIVKTKG